VAAKSRKGEETGMDGEAPNGARGATLVTQTAVRPGRENEFASWQRRMSALVSGTPGFVSEEVIPADPPLQADWTIIQRFACREDASNWLASAARAAMLEQVADLLEGEDAISIMEQAGRPHRGSTAVIRSSVAPGQEKAYRDWQAAIQAAQAKMPGFVGCAVQEPISGVQDQWVTLLAFESGKQLDAWLSSGTRASLLRKAEGIVARDEVSRVESGFEGWFDFGRSAGTSAPPAWKFNYLVLAGLYPIVMLEILYLTPKLFWMNPAFSNLIGNIFSVGILGWPVVAILGKVMGWWVQPAPGASKWTDLKGALVMIGVLAVLVFGFYFIATYVGGDAPVPKI
jgi:antibiotic biosynthesis monooxygenase (ABM) superfamily enzyme